MKRLSFTFLVMSFLILFIAPSSSFTNTEQKVDGNGELQSVTSVTNDSANDYSNQGDMQIAVAKSLKNLNIFIPIALGVSLIIVVCMVLNNRGVKTTNASTYLQPGSFILNNEQDIYSGTTTTQREINTDTGNSNR